jgi:hypothetical protein
MMKQLKNNHLTNLSPLLILLLVSIFLASCAVSSTVRQNVTYISQDFSKQSIDSRGLSLLPIVAGSGVEGYRRPFGEAMNQSADSALTNFMRWNETLDRLNDAQLVSDYNNAIQSYQQTGIIDRSILQKMYEATGKNYFFYVELLPPTADRDLKYNYFSGGVTRTETKSVTAFGLVWSAIDGDVVWEGSATAEVTTGDYSYTQETDMQRAEKVAKTLMNSLLN